MTEALAVEQAPNRVTIVVPIYGHWESLRACISSLILYADPNDFDVLLVNDSGPDADEIEAGILGLIYGHRGFRYERNPENLGFVKTCNRAVFELDQTENDILLLNSDTQVTEGALQELRAVLNLSERHAVVCPRSNDATIASIPFFLRDAGAERSRDRSEAVFAEIAPLLPRYYIAPVAIGFCFLVRRSLIQEHGLFDEVYGSGYNEENDFCLRLNALGYSSLIANHALVFHVGSTSFGSLQRATLEAENAKTLHKRFPFYPGAVVSFIQNDYEAADRFADLLVQRADFVQPKVLIDLYGLSTNQDDTAKDALSFLEYVSRLDPSAAEVTVAAAPAAIERFRLAQYGLKVIDYGTIDEVFDVGVALAPVANAGQLVRLNRYCVRWVIAFRETITLRSWALRIDAQLALPIARIAFEHADVVVGHGESLADIGALFPETDGTAATGAKVVNHEPGTRSTQFDAEVWDQIVATSASPHDFTTLRKRDRAIHALALTWAGLRHPLAAAQSELASIKSSRSYRLAQKIAAVATHLRRLLR